MVYKRGSAWDYHSVASSIEIVYENPLCRVTLLWVKPKFMFNSNWGHPAQGVAEIAIFFYCCFSFIRVQTRLQNSSVTRLLSLFQLKTFFASKMQHSKPHTEISALSDFI